MGNQNDEIFHNKRAMPPTQLPPHKILSKMTTFLITCHTRKAISECIRGACRLSSMYTLFVVTSNNNGDDLLAQWVDNLSRQNYNHVS